ncbi:hypothetical protein [Aliarcobacter butzleri]|uniref:hypothetical protein n=1 Tax=Aliarcobacter butzleri TaxID=28197 RepID=UPI002B2514A3|nr:hypothetical protein [Aliarcobacter butzleri]
MINNQVQDEINSNIKEIEKFIKQKKHKKLIIVANEIAYNFLIKTYASILSENVENLFIVNNKEYRELNKNTLDGAKIIMPKYLDMSVIMGASNYNL